MPRAYNIAFAAFAALASFSSAQYVNPLQGSLSTHDPVIFKQDGIYYIFHTGNGVSIKTSSDRITWSAGTPSRVIAQNAYPAWHTTYVSGFNNTNGSLWAPDIHYRAGKYWLYYSVSSFGSRVSAIGLRTNTTLNPNDTAYQWVDQGMVVCTHTSAVNRPDCFISSDAGANASDTNAHNAIDPNVVLDSAGIPWLAWGSFGSGIKLIRLNPLTGKPDSGAKAISIARRYATSAPDGSGYYRSVEGPFIHKRGPWFYLFVSYDRCCNGAASTYKTMVSRAASVTGPYYDKAGQPMQPPYGNASGTAPANAGTLVSASTGRWKGTGHNAVFIDHDTTFLVNHSYDSASNGATTLMIRPLYWDALGWPTLDSTQGAVSIARGATAPVPVNIERKMKGLWIPWKGALRDMKGRTGN